jgi:AraC family transcriptional regulator
MEIRQVVPEAAGRNKPLPYCDFWSRSSKLLLSSVNRGLVRPVS